MDTSNPGTAGATVRLTLKQRITLRAWSFLPQKQRVLRLLSMLPTPAKRAFVSRLAALVLPATDIPADMLFATDMGLGTGARLHLPVKVAPVYLFGDPAQTYGEEPALRLCRVLLQRCPSFVDVGAHLGLYLWYLLPLLRDKRVIYFEPNEELFGMLQRNLSLNGLAHAEGFCQAIGDRIGETICLVQSIPRVPHAVRFMVLEVLPDAWQSGFVEVAMRETHMQGYLIRTDELVTSAKAVQTNAHGDRNWLFCRETPSHLADIVHPAGFSVVS